MAIFVTKGRAGLAIAVKAQALHLAWGTGDAAWDATPVAEPASATGLVAELGRRVLSVCEFVVPDSVSGTIILPDGSKWSVSTDPTGYLHVKAIFDYFDAPTSVIRELGLFQGSTFAGGLPGGQVYFQPGDVTSSGTLMVLQRIPKIIRSSSQRQSFEFVHTF